MKLPIVAICLGLFALGLVATASADAGPDTASLVDAGVQAAGSAAAAPTVPDPNEAPGESASLLYKLYKAGQLVPAIILLVFFGLKVLEKRIEWLRTGWRKLGVAALMGGLAMLIERAASETTPNLSMLLGAIGAAIAMVVNAKGDEKPAEAT